MNYLKTFLPYLFGNKKGKSLEIPLPKPIPWPTLCFEEILMFHALSNSLNQYLYSINFQTLSRKDIFHLFNYSSMINHELMDLIAESFPHELALFNEAVIGRALNKDELQELIDFKNDELTVFAILRKNRERPGILVVRRPDGFFVSEKMNVWSIPILAFSGRGLPFHHSNGCTPCGVYTIDSVMPETDKGYEFGKFRRLIVNFIAKAPDESGLTKHLPLSHHHKSWWKPSLVARELGRSLLRIHGTGRTNYNPLSPFYPFVPTSGCLATKETRILGKTVAFDQRLLLDTLMHALNLPAISANESKIHGLLYVVELDDNLSTLRFMN